MVFAIAATAALPDGHLQQPLHTLVPRMMAKQQTQQPKQQQHQPPRLSSSDTTVDTTDTGSRIPAYIYIRHNSSKHEVPDDAPLGDCFNIPLPLRACDIRKAKRNMARKQWMRRLWHWGIGGYCRYRALLFGRQRYRMPASDISGSIRRRRRRRRNKIVL